MNETQVQLMDPVKEYSQWLVEQSSIRARNGWTEVSLPLLDESNDHLSFYMRVRDGQTEFSDDGWTLADLSMRGVSTAGARGERMETILRRFGASLDNGVVTLKTEGSRPDALNRFVQALMHVRSLSETSSSRVATYFAEDVANALESNGVFFTRDIIIRGASTYAHSFDFLFQRNADHPTRYCDAPNQFNKTAVRDIMFAWQDTMLSPERRGSQLIVIGDDREHALNKDARTAFENLGVQVLPYSSILDGKGLGLVS